MRYLILILVSLLMSFSVFSQAMRPPVSIQRIENASLTCPAKKWCNVNVQLSLAVGTGGTNTYSQSVADSFNVILKSGETITGSKSAIDQYMGTACVPSNPIYARALVGAVIIGSVEVSTGGSCTAYGHTRYSFYSMEYYN